MAIHIYLDEEKRRKFTLGVLVVTRPSFVDPFRDQFRKLSKSGLRFHAAEDFRDRQTIKDASEFATTVKDHFFSSQKTVRLKAFNKRDELTAYRAFKDWCLNEFDAKEIRVWRDRGTVSKKTTAILHPLSVHQQPKNRDSFTSQLIGVVDYALYLGLIGNKKARK